MTAERFISVWFPFKCKELCSRRRVVIVWSVIAVVLFACDSQFFVTAYVAEYIIPSSVSNGTPTVSYFCTFYSNYTWFVYVTWPWIDACLGDFVPFIVVFIGNVAITVQITIASRRRAMQTQATALASAAAAGGGGGGGGKDKRAAASKKVYASLTYSVQP